MSTFRENPPGGSKYLRAEADKASPSVAGHRLLAAAQSIDDLNAKIKAAYANPKRSSSSAVSQVSQYWRFELKPLPSSLHRRQGRNRGSAFLYQRLWGKVGVRSTFSFV